MKKASVIRVLCPECMGICRYSKPCKTCGTTGEVNVKITASQIEAARIRQSLMRQPELKPEIIS